MPVLVSFALMYVVYCILRAFAYRVLNRLYGTFTSQVYFYWKEYKNDPARMKYWVSIIW